MLPSSSVTCYNGKISASIATEYDARWMIMRNVANAD